MAVPTVFLNGEVFGQGRMSAGGDRRQARHRRAARAKPRRSTPRTPFDVLVVGGGPAGAAAAIYAARKGIRTGVRRRALRRPGARHHGDRELHLGPAHRGPEARRGAGAARASEYDVDIMNLQRADEAGAGGRARRPGRRSSWRTAPRCSRTTVILVHRRALAPDGRARRGRVPQQGRGLLPALRRPAVQGQARRGDRRRQLRRRGGDRPGRHRRATSR